MKRITQGICIVSLLLLAPLAAADEPAEPDAKTVAHVTKVIEVVEAGDDEELAKLAKQARHSRPPLWILADHLCAKGRLDVATTLARASEAPELEELLAYIEDTPNRNEPPELRRAFAQGAKLFVSGMIKQALPVLEAVDVGPPSVTAARLVGAVGHARYQNGDAAAGADTLARAAELAKRIGWRRQQVICYYEAGVIANLVSDLTRAAQYWELTREATLAYDMAAHTAEVSSHLAVVYDKRGMPDRALELHHHALAYYEEHGQTEKIAVVIGNIGLVHSHLGDFTKAIAMNERALAMKRAVGDERGALRTLGNIASIQSFMADRRKALATLHEVLSQCREKGYEDQAAKSLSAIGSTLVSLGRLAEALPHYEEALRIYRKHKNPLGTGFVLGRLASFYNLMRDYKRAERYGRKAVKELEKTGSHTEVANALMTLAVGYQYQEEYEKALAHYDRVLALRRESKSAYGHAEGLLNRGNVLVLMDRHEEGLASQREALAMSEKLEKPDFRASVDISIADTLVRMGKHEDARTMLAKALEDALELSDRWLALAAIETQAELAVRLEDDAWLIDRAQQSIDLIEQLGRKLADEERARSLERWSKMLGRGVAASVRLGREAEAFELVEAGRSTALREALGGADALRAALLPEELGSREAAARADEAAAVNALRRAKTAGAKRSKMRALRKAVDAARLELQDVVSRVQRAARQAADVVYAEPITLEQAQALVQPKQALVLYALSPDDAAAIVVTRDATRTVGLGGAEAIRETSARLVRDETGALDAAARKELAALVVKPLELGTQIEQLLISPDDVLAYVPFSVLVGERDVTLIPSASTLAVLSSSEAEGGKGILALGDPSYGARPAGRRGALRSGFNLTPLPATREEARAIGDVLLLGAEATEGRLKKALEKQARWRAVHLACHGLVDPERPAFCSLALTPSDADDGFFTANEVLRTRVPADLVALSACETGKGRIYAGEGIFGLTRAFMLAGASRVLVSLWKVDDRATRMLMEAFYRGWTEQGLTAGAALRAAQKTVRDFEEEVLDRDASRKAGREVRVKARPFTNPRYWAGWVLWGLP